MSLGSLRAVACARMTFLRRSHIPLCGQATSCLSVCGHLGCCHLSAVNVGVQTPTWDLPVICLVVYTGVELLGPVVIRVEALEALRTVSHVPGTLVHPHPQSWGSDFPTSLLVGARGPSHLSVLCVILTPHVPAFTQRPCWWWL